MTAVAPAIVTTDLPVLVKVAQGEGLEVNARRFLSFLGHLPEVQALDLPDRWAQNIYGFPTTTDEAIRLLTEGERKLPQGVYLLVNEINPAIRARAPVNKWHAQKGKGHGTKDTDIIRRAALYIDVDWHRPTGISATDAECDQALAAAAAIHARFATVVPASALGFGHSGNGAAVFIALDHIAARDEVYALCREIVLCADAIWTEPRIRARPSEEYDGIGIDTSVVDAKRLVPAFGTLKRKGDATSEERPHRRTAFIGPEEPTRLGLGDLTDLLTDLRADLTAELAAEVDKAMGRRGASTTALPAVDRPAGGDAFTDAKACDIRAVMGWLGLVNGEYPVCCGCGLSGDSSVAFYENGLKCSHARCSKKALNGFRTTIDVVMEARGLTAKEAMRALGERFGFDTKPKPLPRATPAAKPGSTYEAVEQALRPVVIAQPAASTPSTPPLPPAERPVIRCNPEIFRIVDESIAALSAVSHVYQRDGVLVTDKQPEGATNLTPQMYDMVEADLTDVLSKVADYVVAKQKKDGSLEYVSCTAPSKALKAMLVRRAYPGVRHLTAIVETPCLKPDGSILNTPGYDPGTRLIYAPTCEIPPVAEAPTQEDAAAALKALLDVFSDFPFAADADRCVPVAAILSLFARPAIDGGTPLFAIDSSMRSSGKSKVCDVVSIVSAGRSAPRASYPPEEIELEKTLCSIAMAGQRLVLLDNVTSKLGGGPLDKVLTADDRVQFRVLGESRMEEPQWRTVLMTTGNNTAFSADTKSRTIICRIEPNVERPEERTGFRYPDLLAHVRAVRPALVHAALTILRAFVVAGRPALTEIRGVGGRFPSWASVVPAAIVFAGGANVLLASATEKNAPDAEEENLRVLLGYLGSVVTEEGKSAAEIVAELWPPLSLGERPGQRPDDGRGPLREAINTMAGNRRPHDPPTAQAVGIAFNKRLGVVVSVEPLPGVRVTRQLAHPVGKEKNARGSLIWVVLESVPQSQGPQGP